MKPDRDALLRAAAMHFATSAKAAVESRGGFRVALSGGSTPRGMHTLLSGDPAFRDGIPWDKIDFFFGDERHVPPGHPDSNYRMANETLLSKIPISQERVWRMRTELPDAAQAADEYEADLRRFFSIGPDEWPVFDLVLLGMGPDGHTASLFPGTRALHETHRLVVKNWVGKFYTDRVTLTAPVLKRAVSILFLVTGEDKAPALKGVLEGPLEPEQLPAQLMLESASQCLWLIDPPAGKMLSKATYRE